MSRGLSIASRENSVRSELDSLHATKVMADTISDAETALAGSLKTLRTDCVDISCFHHFGDRQVDKARDADGVLTWLLKQKQAGKCRFVGLSGQNFPGRFVPLLEHGDVEVILVAINFAARYTDNVEESVLPVARKHNTGIVAMKGFGAPDEKTGSWGTRQALPRDLWLPLAGQQGATNASLSTARALFRADG